MTHHELILGVDLNGGWPEKRIDGRGWSSGRAVMEPAVGLGIPAKVGHGRARGEAAEVRDEVEGAFARGIEGWWPEEGEAPAEAAVLGSARSVCKRRSEGRKRKAAGRLRIKMNANPEYPGISELSR